MYSTNLIDGAGHRSYLYPYLRTRTDMRRRIPSILGAPDMIVVNLTNDKIWVREGLVPQYPNMAPPQFAVATQGGLVVPAPNNRRQDVQEQSLRDAEIPPEQYYPKGYQPELMPFWPSGKPILLPQDRIPEAWKKKATQAQT